MKKFNSFALAALTVIAAASCAKEKLTGDKVIDGRIVRICANLADTKASLDGESLKVMWTEGDKIAVWDDGSESFVQFNLVSGAGTASAYFEGEISGNAVVAVSPFEAASEYTEGTIKVDIPETQTIKEGEIVSSQALVSVGSVSGGNLSFHNVVSLLKFTIQKEGVTLVALTGNGGETFATSAKVDATGVIADASTLGGAKAKIAMENGAFEKDKDYYMAIFPSAFENGIRAVATTDACKYIKASESACAFARNQTRNMGNIFDGTTLPYTISNKEELKAFGANATVFEVGEWVKLGADIDYDGTWTAVANFVANFDGQNHSIYNLSFAANPVYPEYLGFFSKLYCSDVKDLKIGCDPSGKYDGNSNINVSSVMEYTGPLAGSIASGRDSRVAKITNVTNYVNTTFIYTTSLGGTSVYFGGLVGSITRANTVIDDCKNYGFINSAASNNTSMYGGEYLGGIAALVKTNNVTLQNCINYGKITPTAKKSASGACFYGGMIGRYGNGSTGNVISGCKNLCTEEMQANAQIGQQMFLGGILGASHDLVSKVEGVYDVVIENCENICPCYFHNLSTNVAAAGMVALMKANYKISGCTNGQQETELGKMSHGDKNVNKISACAGIVGYVSTTATGVIEDCTNYAPVVYGTTGNSTLAGAGGILGAAEAGGFAAISNCTNYGNVSLGISVNDKPAGAGGIIGANNSNCTIENCSNFGDVSASGISNLNAAGGLVGYQADVEQTGAGCFVDCKVTSANGGGIIVGNNVGTSTWGTSGSKVKVAGSVNATDLDASNYTSHLYAGSGTATCFAEYWAK